MRLLNECDSHFNSIKVRLERIVFDTKEHGIINFNSIKVRLEHKLLAPHDSTSCISIP